VVCDEAEGAVLAAATALGHNENARLTVPEPLDPDLLTELPPAAYRSTWPTSHEYSWGKLLRYDDERFRRRHREGR